MRGIVVSMLVLAAVPATAHAAKPPFPAPYIVISPERIWNKGPEGDLDDPRVLAAADFDHDGTADLLTGMEEDGTYLLLGRRDRASSRVAGTIYGGTYTQCLAVGDIDGDGNPDFAVLAWDRPRPHNAEADVVLGRGDGTFDAPIEFGVPALATSIALGDVNGDGLPDVVMLAGDSVCVALGVGDGTMGASLGTYIGEAHAIAVGDLNGDGRADVVACMDSSACVTVMLGEPDGLRVVGRYPTAGRPGQPTIADMDGDHRTDVLIGGDDIALLRGNGDGTLRLPLLIAMPPKGSGSMTVADFDHDGLPDIVALGVGVLLNDGGGSFTRVDSLEAPPWSDGLVTGDWDGDGAIDVAMVSRGVLEFFNEGDGTFGAHHGTIPIPDGMLGFRDLDGDGKPDIVGSPILLANGDGTFRAAGDAAGAVSFVDLNGDGVLDLVGVDFTRLGIGDGTFGPPLAYTGGAQRIGVADVNDDGRADLLFSDEVLFGKGDGTFVPGPGPSVLAAPFADIRDPTAIAGVADLTGDGIPDILVFGQCVACGDPMTRLGILRGHGDGTFEPDSTYGLSDWADAVWIGDVNGDGRPDVVATTSEHDRYWTGLDVFLQSPQGHLESPIGGGINGYSHGISLEDVNGDGCADLQAWNSDLSALALLLGQPSGRFADEVDLGTDGGFLVDVDGDGAVDLVKPNGSTAEVWYGHAGSLATSLATPAERLGPALACFPNPVRASATIRFTAAAAGRARVRVYDITGREVATLLDRDIAAGAHTLSWDRRSRSGSVTPPGVYLCELTVAGRRSTSRIVTVGG